MTEGEVANLIDARLEQVAEGVWSPAQFIDAMADLVGQLRGAERDAPPE